jgi:hypothetical protein
MEILRLDNEVRAALGLPRRQDFFTQPWRIPNTKPEHRIRLVYTFMSDIELDGCFLGIERPEETRITLNGETAPAETSGYFVDAFIRKAPLPRIRRGENWLELELPFGRKSNLEVIHLLGNFGVDLTGGPHLVSPPESIAFGDITYQKLPFYTGNVTYAMAFTLEAPGAVVIGAPHFTAPLLGLTVDGLRRGNIAFSPHQFLVEGLAAGQHELEVCAYGSRQNAFGALHNANDDFKWYGPDSYRTSGDEWSESYRIRPVGILSRVEVYPL